MRSRRAWCLALIGIVAAGILSRLAHTGIVAFDKYLGDVLYAAMVYSIFRLLRPAGPVTLWALAAMTAIELFQLTGIAGEMLTNQHAIVWICARLLGTQFSFGDLLAYAAGIACIRLLDSPT